MKTAVDWLVDHLYLVISNEERNFLEGLRKEALEKEKEQIMNAVGLKKSTKKDTFGNNRIITLTPEEYYNQTYNQNK